MSPRFRFQPEKRIRMAIQPIPHNPPSTKKRHWPGGREEGQRLEMIVQQCTAYGIRTRVTGVRGQRPRPLDERGRRGLLAQLHNLLHLPHWQVSRSHGFQHLRDVLYRDVRPLIQRVLSSLDRRPIHDLRITTLESRPSKRLLHLKSSSEARCQRHGRP
jgi:hypothetical protein